MGIFDITVFALIGTSFLAFFVWVFKESWNQPGMSQGEINWIFKRNRK